VRRVNTGNNVLTVVLADELLSRLLLARPPTEREKDLTRHDAFLEVGVAGVGYWTLCHIFCFFVMRILWSYQAGILLVFVFFTTTTTQGEFPVIWVNLGVAAVLVFFSFTHLHAITPLPNGRGDMRLRGWMGKGHEKRNDGLGGFSNQRQQRLTVG